MRIVAYGSLMQRASLERALGRAATLEPILIEGYARIFNAPFPSSDGMVYAYLNLVERPGSIMQAAWFELVGVELDKFAEREAGSKLIEVSPGYFAFVWPAHLAREVAVLQSYIDFCQVGADELAVDLSLGLIQPRRLIYDRSRPKYPDMGQ